VLQLPSCHCSSIHPSPILSLVPTIPCPHSQNVLPPPAPPPHTPAPPHPSTPLQPPPLHASPDPRIPALPHITQLLVGRPALPQALPFRARQQRIREQPVAAGRVCSPRAAPRTKTTGPRRFCERRRWRRRRRRRRRWGRWVHTDGYSGVWGGGRWRVYAYGCPRVRPARRRRRWGRRVCGPSAGRIESVMLQRYVGVNACIKPINGVYSY
jgi:hypothetical protein